MCKTVKVIQLELGFKLSRIIVLLCC